MPAGSKNIPEKTLQNVAAEVMGLEEFDEAAFAEQVEEILVVSEDTLRFQFYDGREVATTWESTAKTDWWTPERRRLWASATSGRIPTQTSPRTTNSQASSNVAAAVPTTAASPTFVRMAHAHVPGIAPGQRTSARIQQFGMKP